ncbi:hypothetical protein EV361DRAFT_511236 [Lentinula raphanica]|nr:hypothetical protein EV361DRAFT_511236 [Lentinula raphanica]
MKVLPTFTILYIFYSSHLLPSCFALPLSKSGLPDAKTVARLKTVQNNQKVLLGYRYVTEVRVRTLTPFTHRNLFDPIACMGTVYVCRQPTDRHSRS